MRNVFVIASSINVPPLFSLFNADTRYKETLKTIESVKQKNDNPYIVLIDNTPLPGRIQIELTHRVDHFLSLHNRKIVQDFNLNGMKGQSELYTMLVAVDYLSNVEFEYDRVFKLSGRYHLTGLFNPLAHNHPGKYVFKKSTSEYYEGSNIFHMSCWSVCRSMLPHMQEFLSKVMVQSMEKLIDIEHTSYWVLPEEYYITIDTLGISGCLALSGEERNE